MNRIELDFENDTVTWETDEHVITEFNPLLSGAWDEIMEVLGIRPMEPQNTIINISDYRNLKVGGDELSLEVEDGIPVMKLRFGKKGEAYVSDNSDK